MTQVDPIGVRHGLVELVPHDPSWAAMYRIEAAKIADACEGLILAIEHIGSTSIPSIHAKPIIDIAIGVSNLEDSDSMEASMKMLGYDYPRDVGIPNQYVFGRGHPVRKYIAHVQVYGSDHWKKYMRFRDSLRENSDLAREYEQLKLGLADRFSHDRAGYGDAKGEFVSNVLEGKS